VTENEIVQRIFGEREEYVDGEHCVSRTLIICVLCLIHARMAGWLKETIWVVYEYMTQTEEETWIGNSGKSYGN
jgi:hypothetical protein